MKTTNILITENSPPTDTSGQTILQQVITRWIINELSQKQ